MVDMENVERGPLLKRWSEEWLSALAESEPELRLRVGLPAGFRRGPSHAPRHPAVARHPRAHGLGGAAFTLLRQVADLLPGDAAAECGMTVEDAREAIELQQWEMALDLLIEIAEVHPVPLALWGMLSESARQMMLDRSRRRCEWHGWEVRHGTVRTRLTLLGADKGGRRSAFSGDGRLRPLWDIGSRAPDRQREVRIARLWVECVQELGPDETADVRFAPLSPEQWRHLKPGDVITMHEGRPAVGTATVIEVRPPRT
ncbi:hypothetical protein GCM10010341_79780 [Streptomyces noursei]|nr:hypothetical protein GCM10010341_79780 [Streptomyces noursei]